MYLIIKKSKEFSEKQPGSLHNISATYRTTTDWDMYVYQHYNTIDGGVI